MSAANATTGLPLTLDSSIGELMVETYTNPSNLITQGFIQSTPFSVSVMELKAIDGRAFPNPVTANLTIELNVLHISGISVEVLDLLGKRQSLPFTSSLFNDKMCIDLNFEGMNSGVYFVQIRDAENTVNRTFKITKFN